MKLSLTIVFILISLATFGQSLQGQWLSIDSTIKITIKKKRALFQTKSEMKSGNNDSFRYKLKSKDRLKLTDDYLTAGMLFGITSNRVACFKITWISENEIKLDWIDEKKSSELLRDKLFKTKLIFRKQ